MTRLPGGSIVKIQGGCVVVEVEDTRLGSTGTFWMDRENALALADFIRARLAEEAP